MKLKEALSLIVDEISRAVDIHDNFNSPHEGYAVIKEELEEFLDELDDVKINGKKKIKKIFETRLDRLWNCVKMNSRKHPEKMELLKNEAVHLAAMATRFLIDFC